MDLFFLIKCAEMCRNGVAQLVLRARIVFFFHNWQFFGTFLQFFFCFRGMPDSTRSQFKSGDLRPAFFQPAQVFPASEKGVRGRQATP